MIAKPKKPVDTIAKYRAKIDKAFNEYIRLRDGACVICGNIESLQCSHYWGKKARPAVRWCELNAHAMCAKCHFLHHHGHEAVYADFMYTQYGNEALDTLRNMSTAQSKLSKAELKEKLEYWKGKLNEIK